MAPLVALVPAPADVRDPHQPFDVVSATMMSDSAWGSVHGNAPAAPAAGASTGTVAGPAPFEQAPRWPVPDQPLRTPGGPASGPTGFPAPGTPNWFSPPPPYAEPPPRSGPGRARDVVDAATPGLCVCLVIGGLIPVLAPIMLVVGVLLSTRVKAGQRPVRLAFRGAAILLGLIAFACLFTDTAVAIGWWNLVGLWALALCWVALVVLLLLVRRALVRPNGPPPPPSPWG